MTAKVERRTGTTAAIVAWVLQVLLCLALAPGGLAKLFGDAAMVELFDDVGAGQWLRYLVGTCEVAGAIGLLIRQVRALAAAGLVLLLLGATITNLFVIDASPWLSSVLAIAAAVVLGLRRQELPVKRRR